MKLSRTVARALRLARNPESKRGRRRIGLIIATWGRAELRRANTKTDPFWTTIADSYLRMAWRPEMGEA